MTHATSTRAETGRVNVRERGRKNRIDTDTLRISAMCRGRFTGSTAWPALTYAKSAQYAELSQRPRTSVQITLNGERFEIEQPLSVTALLDRLDIDPRRVAVEHNLSIIKRQRFPEVVVGDGDTVEIVNFVGGG